jgi:hypothetical protein
MLMPVEDDIHTNGICMGEEYTCVPKSVRLHSIKIVCVTERQSKGGPDGPSSFRVEPNSQNRWSSSSPVGMWAGCL